MVMGIWKSFTICIKLGSFSMPSSIVTNTTFSVIGTCENTVGSDALSVIGLTAGGAGAGANGPSPSERGLIRSASTPEVAGVDLGDVLVPLSGEAGAPGVG